METLEKKLQQIKGMLPSPKMPKAVQAAEVQQPEAAPKPVTISPKSQKDPTKVAEQLENSDFKDQTLDQARKLKGGIKESVTFNDLGQWKIK